MSRTNQILYHQEIKGVLKKSRVRKQSKTKKRPNLRKYKTKSKLRSVIRAQRKRTKPHKKYLTTFQRVNR